MILKNLYKLTTAAITVANNKAENLVNRGIRRLERIDSNGASIEIVSGGERARENPTFAASLSTNTDLIIVVTQDRCTKKVVFSKDNPYHKKVIQEIENALYDSRALL